MGGAPAGGVAETDDIEDVIDKITAMLYEKGREYQKDLYVAAVDFKKAFDTILHNQIWQALRESGVSSVYISVLQRLYSGLSGSILADCRSRPFKILRGSKQGDPMSPGVPK